MTQTDRVLAALRAHPDRGLTRVDFLRFPTIDGGPPIINLPARILELKDLGHPIEDAGTSDKCKVYRLARGTLPTAEGSPASPDGQLFAAPSRRLNSAIYGDEAA